MVTIKPPSFVPETVYIPEVILCSAAKLPETSFAPCGTVMYVISAESAGT